LLPPDTRFKVKYTKFDFGWGCVPDRTGEEACSALPDHLAEFERAKY